MATIQQKAGEEADRMIAELSQQRAVATQGGAPAENQAPEAEAIPEVQSGEAGIQADVGVQPMIAPQVDASELASLRKEVETANQRWRVLQGMIDKKEAEVDNMRTLLAQVNQKAETPEAKKPLITEQDSENFGDDWIDMMGRKALMVVQPQLDIVIARITELEKSIKGVSDVTARTSAEVFDDALERQVPDWKNVNVDPAFLAWLAEEEGLSGSSRLDLLKDAYSRSDLARTVRFFNAFKGTTGQIIAPAQEPKKDNVTKLISPGKSRSSTTPMTQDTKQIWSSADISRLYDDKRNGRITQEVFNEYERDLFKAQVEGRLVA